MYTILGAGLAGISASYHLGHENCIVFEKNDHAGGHIYSEVKNGFTWDEGPHVSFTKNEYVRELFAKSLNNQFLEYPVYPTNYFKGNWVPHPAQANLYAIPEPLRTACLNDFLETRMQSESELVPSDYQTWLEMAFGKTFANNFPSLYTTKYWTLPPELLNTSWIGDRVFYPDVESVISGFEKPTEHSKHYITSVRYPTQGGYFSYASSMLEGMRLNYNYSVDRIDLEGKIVYFSNGHTHKYQKLISTLPLPEFINYCNPPAQICESANKLICSQLLLINLEIGHPSIRNEHWLYVYDVDKYSTRINFTELLSANNAPTDNCGIQVEVYFSKYKPLTENIDTIAEKVSMELIEMGLIKDKSSILNVQTKWVPYANVIFDHFYKENLNIILGWLNTQGLAREADDLKPMTDWKTKWDESIIFGDLMLAGRYAQWKYYWTDDCVLRGKLFSED